LTDASYGQFLSFGLDLEEGHVGTGVNAVDLQGGEGGREGGRVYNIALASARHATILPPPFLPPSLPYLRWKPPSLETAFHPSV